MWRLKVIENRPVEGTDLEEGQPIIIFNGYREALPILAILPQKFLDLFKLDDAYSVRGTRIDPSWSWRATDDPQHNTTRLSAKGWRGRWGEGGKTKTAKTQAIKELQLAIDVANQRSTYKLEHPIHPPWMQCPECGTIWGWDENAPNKVRADFKCPKCHTKSFEIDTKPTPKKWKPKDEKEILERLGL